MKCRLFGLGLLVLRVGLGTVFFAHGAQKVLGWWGGSGLEGTVQAFVNMGKPEWIGYAISFGELLGGTGILVGCLTRLAALGISVIMGGAVVLVHWPNGFFLNLQGIPDKGHGIEFAFALLCMSLTLVLTGPGGISIDRILFKGRCHHHQKETPSE